MNANRIMGRIAICALLAIAGCKNDLGIPTDPSALDGVVVARDTTTLHVKHEPGEQCGVVFRVDARTDLLQRTATGTIERARFEDMVVGREVRVWAGAIAESCPGQALATAIELLP